MTARQRRLISDWEQVKKDFGGHKNIIINPIGEEPFEKYNVIFFVNGISILPDGTIEMSGRHEVEIILHAEYPRYKPICKIKTSIWHPNFRDGEICIGDIWGAGESLSDIIINIGDMIQYKSWNAFSPLSAKAAEWAIENKHLFPVGNIELRKADFSDYKDNVEIDLFDETINNDVEIVELEKTKEEELSNVLQSVELDKEKNDFDITPEELEGIEFVPTTQRMHAVSGNIVKSKKINFKTIFIKGIIWAFIGAILGFGISELTSKVITKSGIAEIKGYDYLSKYIKYGEKADDIFSEFYDEFEEYCKKNNLNPDSESAIGKYTLANEDNFKQMLEKHADYYDKANDAIENSYKYEFNSDKEEMKEEINFITKIEMALWSSVISMFIGVFLGIGEGVYYGSKVKALRYASIGAGISLVMGFVSGYLAQWMYSELISNDAGDLEKALVRGIGWAVMGLGIGLAIGLIKPAVKRIIFCSIGGFIGAFIGGFLFNYICGIFDNGMDVIARGIAVVTMGLLIGIGVGLLEQFAKAAWLKVVRGEFEGKEYLVFSGKTSIGNNGKNTIVLFKDKLIGPNHCDIILQGSKYILLDKGTPMGTVVNGQKIIKHILKKGDTIAIGNSVLVFNTK